ncbi:MAG: type II secretion system F family protein [Deltaproteobacteria bacterium]|nr:type II secretion system F family protein [Deltaproteobacteria bacterium]MCX7952170.1 type II secretion system F family protein [Deltaproteobacteria bacterium]
MIIWAGVLLLLLVGLLLAYNYVESKPKTAAFNRTFVSKAQPVRTSTPLSSNVKKTEKKSKKLSHKELLFKAGIVSSAELKKFYLIGVLSPVVGFASLFSFGFYLAGNSVGNIFGILGAILGFLYPRVYLRRKAKERQEEISFYLPIVIEQLAIGVASGLDIGPCIQLVLDLADDRQTNNAVTELLKLAVQMSRQGIPFDEALLEIGKMSGNVELKHAFLALGQVYKHGGEISKQLMEIANSVNHHRQIKIEEKIKKLPIKGVLIVGVLLFGFMTLILFGLAMTVATHFKGIMTSEQSQ